MSEQMSTTKRALIEIRELRARLEAAERRQAEPIAIVGMGVRLPGGVETLDGFWQLLQEGRDAISEVPADRWPVDRFFDADPSAAGKMSTRFGGFLDGVDRFDARFFGITPREAASMDPQQRLLLEVAWEALENAGQAPDQLDGHPTGVFVGLSAFDYLIAELKGTPYEAIDAYLASGGAPSVASGRLSFILGLRGPSVTVDTACSSSLTAVHLACQSLRAGDCSMALAGGVNLILLPEFNINLSKAGMMAADGRCKTFAASADGYVRSEGCGVIVLKRLSDAIANGDRVLAVVRGSAVNQDGRSSGLTVPNGPAQEDVIRGALARAGVSAAQVGYVEAHGTGTSLGDPIELRALGSVYGNGRNGDEPLWVGSVKTNLGHLESAAGVTGLIKLVLALQHQQIPPHLHVATPTSRVPWSSLGLRVPSEAVGWPGEAGGRVGAVSSFGFSGTNAHLIVGEAPVATPKPVAKDRVRHVLTLSAKSAAALRSLAERWRAFVDTINANHSLGDVCFTANAGRAHFAHRAAVVSASFAELRQGLDAVVSAREAAHVCRGELGPGPGTDVAFVFPNGLGAYPPMRALFDQEPGFRTSLERCDAIVTARLGRSVLDVILDGRMTPDGDGSDAAAAWALQASLAELWLSWGVTPRFVTGAGVGAAVAAQIAGAISADDACALAIGEAAAPAAINEPRFAIVAQETGELVSNARLQLEGFWKVSTRDHTVALDAIKTRGVDVVLHFGTAASRTDAARVTSFAAIDASTMPDVHLPELLAQLYVRGVAIAWRDVDGPFARQRVALPTYPFERERHWSEFVKPAGAIQTDAAARNRFADWLHEVAWRKDAVDLRPAAALRRVTIVADRGGVADSLAARLRARGVEPRLVRGRDEWSAGVRDCGDAVVMLRGLDIAAADTATGSQVQGAVVAECDELIAVIRDLANAGSQPPRLVVVTAAAHAVAGGAVAPAQAPLAALAAVANSEHPDLRCTSFDIDAAITVETAADAVVRELLSADVRETRVAVRDGVRYVARLVPAAGSSLTPIAVRGDATYLITGGAGALGLQVATSLISLGARHLVLIGRREPGDDLRARLSGWADQDVDVRYVRGDVSNHEFVASLFGSVLATMPALAGVCHTAGVLDDGVLLQQSAERFDRVMTPKVAGAWNLHRAVGDRPLEFFVTFSSLASIFGTAGQGNYAAANAFLDALAFERRRRNLAGTSIAWGPWDEAGMAVTIGDAGNRRWAAQGLERIDVATGLTLFHQLGAREASPLSIVAPIDWRVYLGARAAADRPALLDELAASVAVADDRPTTNTIALLAGLSAADRHAQLLALTREHVIRVLGLPLDERIDPRRGLLDLGIDSLMALELRNSIQRAIGHTLPATFTFDHPTLDAMASFLTRTLSAAAEAAVAAPSVAPRADSNRASTEPVAIVGLGCRLPGGINSPDAFWRMLHDGVDGITQIPDSRWNIDDYYDPDPNVPGKMATRWGGFLDGADQFDPQFFGIAPREATSMDPQQRLLLEVAWEALEHAGQAPDRLHNSRTGVFVGISTNEYAQLQLRRTPLAQLEGHVGTGSASSVAAGRLSYSLGLQGPAMAVDTACSSSLVAVHLACQSLRSGECETALAGGVNLILAPEGNVILSRARMLSPDGRCKTFDASANGYVRSEGCGIVVLKRLSDAISAGDRVLAVIRGTAVNQDGRSGGLTVPNGPAQESLIRDALHAAGVEPSEIDYVEAHGTGTSLGDPIEVRALAGVFGGNRAGSRPLFIGSVKTNVGHLEPAAGIAGLIKVVLSLQHNEIPPHLHLTSVNPLISLDSIPAQIPTSPVSWTSDDRPRRAGVSSFGFSGTNAHAVIEEAPASTPPATIERPHHVLAVSAKTPAALRELAGRYAEHLDQCADRLADVAFTANVGRSHFDCRIAVTGDANDEVAKALRARAAAVGDDEVPDRPKVAFLYTGQGAQYAGMARELYHCEPTFKNALDRCAELLDRELNEPLFTALFDEVHGSGRVDQTQFTQPALFAVEYALAEMWRAWGVQPAAVMGHSVGEFAAACTAGVLTLEDAAVLIAARGRLMQALPAGGAMAAVFTTEARVLGLIGGQPGISIAAVNADDHIVISGDAARVDAVRLQLSGDGIASRPLVVSHAFHSPLIRPMLNEFERLAQGVTPQPATIPFISNVTGRRMAAGERCDAAYWRTHAAQPVRFSDGIRSLVAEGCRVFLEIGPQPTLIGMGRRIVVDPDCAWLPALRRGRSDWLQTVETVAALYERGVDVDWRAFEGEGRRHIAALPSYPFQRERYWLADDSDTKADAAHRGESAPKRSLESIRQRCQPGDAQPTLMPRLWRGVDEALAEIDLIDVPGIEPESMDLHPLLPNACVMAARAALGAGTFTLSGLRALDPTGPMPKKLFVYARSLEGQDGQRHVKVELLDPAGAAVGTADITFKVAAAAVTTAPTWSTNDAYSVSWELKGIPGGDGAVGLGRLSEPGILDRAVEERLTALDAASELSAYGDSIVELERLATGHIVRAFAQLGWAPREGDAVEPIALADALGIASTQRPLFDRLLAYLAEEGVLQASDDGYRVRQPLPQVDLGTHRLRIEKAGHARNELALLTSCGERLVDVLRGDVPGVEVLFPKAAINVAEAVYTESPAARVYNDLIRQAVDAIIGALPVDRLIRVLEVGAGTGSTTSAVLPMLPRGRTRYVYTDLSPTLLQRAREKFASFDFIDYRTFDVERPGTMQGFAAGEFDLIIAANVLHATCNLRATLGHVRQLVADNGLILFAEATQSRRWLDITFGLTEGWWRFEDRDVRSGQPLISREAWLSLLHTTGFESGRALPAASPDSVLSSNAILIARAAAASSVPSEDLGKWVVFVDEHGVGASIAMTLRARGAHCVEVGPGSSNAIIASDRIEIDSSRPDAYSWLFSQLTDQDIRAVIDCWPLNAPRLADAAPASFDEAHLQTCGSVLHLARSLASLQRTTRLWVITRDAMAVADGDTCQGALQSTAWGLGRVVALEHPQFWGGLIDLSPDTAAHSATRIVDVIANDDGEDQVALRAEGRYVARLSSTAAVETSTVSLRRDATYLVTGGAGGVGLRIAKEMARQGAGHLVLMSRSAREMTAEQQAAIRDMESFGTRVTTWAGDVAAPADVDRLREQLPQWPALRGVVHAASHIDARRIVDLGFDDLLTMLRPKVAGTLLIDQLTRDAALDFFVLFSSTAGVFGAVSLAHYAAANVFLDTFARARRRAGAVATSISWGTWEVIRGTDAEQQDIDRGGLKIMPVARTLDAFMHLLRPADAHVVFASIDWHTLKPLYESKRRRPFFAAVGNDAPTAAVKPADGADALRMKLAAARPTERLSVLRSQIRDVAAAVLGLRPNQVDVRKGLFDLGMDSLMSVDLKNRLETTLGQKLPATLTFNYPSVSAITDFVATSIMELDTAGGSAPRVLVEGQRPAAAADGEDDLSEDELVSLLAERLEKMSS